MTWLKSNWTLTWLNPTQHAYCRCKCLYWAVLRDSRLYFCPLLLHAKILVENIGIFSRIVLICWHGQILSRSIPLYAPIWFMLVPIPYPITHGSVVECGHNCDFTSWKAIKLHCLSFKLIRFDTYHNNAKYHVKSSSWIMPFCGSYLAYLATMETSKGQIE